MNQKVHTVHHLVKNKKMYPGQLIHFDAENKNTLYNIFFGKEYVNSKGRDIFQVLKDNDSSAGLQLDREDAYLLHKYMNHLIRAIRELIVEMVRHQEFPHYPSRLNCLYACKTYDEALKMNDIIESYDRVALQVGKRR